MTKLYNFDVLIRLENLVFQAIFHQKNDNHHHYYHADGEQAIIEGRHYEKLKHQIVTQVLATFCRCKLATEENSSYEDDLTALVLLYEPEVGHA